MTIQNIAKEFPNCYPLTRSVMNQNKNEQTALHAAKKAYWNANITVVLILMGIWFLFGCILSIFAVDQLNQVKIGGFPLGFWMAQQGTTIAFIFVVFAYVLIMKRLDVKFLKDAGLAEKELPPPSEH